MHPSIKLEKIPNKGKGLIALEKIPIGTIIVKELPIVKIPSNETIFSDMFQLLFIIVNADAPTKKLFSSLLPETPDNFMHHKKNIFKELKNLSKMKNKLANKIYYHFITNFSSDEIVLLCAKYICNAFDFGPAGPVILPTGTLLNHSCNPNVTFNVENGFMVFKTNRNIKAGEELCDNYIDPTLPIALRKSMLKKRYGFECMCTKCLNEMA
jgi:hypothetical protein